MADIITLEDKRKCVERELAMRRQVYPRWVDNKKISAGKAAHEIAVMEKIVEDYMRGEIMAEAGK